MRFVDEFRDGRTCARLAAKIRALDAGPAAFMEVCGTHTMAIFRCGLRGLVGERVKLVSGPGCPVCVTSQSDIDSMIALARIKDVTLASFGDMLRVPGSKSSLEKERAAGADIRAVYSPADALRLARLNRKREVVFLGVGFETTSPAVASVITDARRERIGNFSVYCAHKLIPPAMENLLSAGKVRIDGFIAPGHVSSIIGLEPYRAISARHTIPCVVTGFEPADILESILLLLQEKRRGGAAARIQYTRAVRPGGNPAARSLLASVFERCDAEWRGLGTIPGSGYRLRGRFSGLDAAKRFALPPSRGKGDPRCLCGKILTGAVDPDRCRLFGKACTPETPAGPCMVSTEGTCAAWYKYNRREVRIKEGDGR